MFPEDAREEYYDAVESFDAKVESFKESLKKVGNENLIEEFKELIDAYNNMLYLNSEATKYDD